jgi:F0F1-type ATP synthase alpha subunit
MVPVGRGQRELIIGLLQVKCHAKCIARELKHFTKLNISQTMNTNNAVTHTDYSAFVNPLGKAIDGKGDIQSKDSRPLEVVAPGVIDRQSVDQPVQTRTH